MDIRDFKEALFKKAEEFGFEEYEIYYNSGSSFTVSIFQAEIEEYKNTLHQGAGFRGIYKGKMGYAYSESINEEAVDFLLKNAMDNAALIENADERLFKGDVAYEKMPPVSEKLINTTVEEKINFALAMEKSALSADERVSAVETAVVATSVGDTYIANSYGLELYKKEGYATAYVEVTAKENEDIKINYEVWQGKDFEGFNPERISKNAAEKTIASLGAGPVKSGKYNVIIENKTMVDILGIYLSNFFAESVQKGFSLLGGKIGEAIANPIVNIYDNTDHEKSLTPLTFDSEGVKVRNKTVVENGVLKAYLYNYKAALKDGVSPTGNGFKRSFKDSISTSCANMYIEQGADDFCGLISKMGEGVVVTDISGLHAGCNEISGDFSLLAEGFLVENGKRARPVEQITIAGNIYQLFKDIKAIGSDLKFEPLGIGGSLGSPSLLVENISISGL